VCDVTATGLQSSLSLCTGSRQHKPKAPTQPPTHRDAPSAVCHNQLAAVRADVHPSDLSSSHVVVCAQETPLLRVKHLCTQNRVDARGAGYEEG
jgi:hypothetical protein